MKFDRYLWSELKEWVWPIATVLIVLGVVAINIYVIINYNVSPWFGVVGFSAGMFGAIFYYSNQMANQRRAEDRERYDI